LNKPAGSLQGLGILLVWASLKPERYYLELMSFFFAFLSAGIFRLVDIIAYGVEDPSQPIVSVIEILVPLYAYYLSKNLN
jgi:hypothetical protein